MSYLIFNEKNILDKIIELNKEKTSMDNTNQKLKDENLLLKNEKQQLEKNILEFLDRNYDYLVS